MNIYLLIYLSHGRHLEIGVDISWTILVKHRFRNSVKDVQTLPGADIDSDHNLLVAKVHTRLKKIIRFQKNRPRWDLEKLYAERQRVLNILEEKLGAIECESENAEVQWKNISEIPGKF